jgi:hypothetical protein
LICTIASGSDEDAVSVRGLVRFGDRITRPAYR